MTMATESDYEGYKRRNAQRKRGRLSPEEKATIDRLAVTLKNPTARYYGANATRSGK